MEKMALEKTMQEKEDTVISTDRFKLKVYRNYGHLFHRWTSNVHSLRIGQILEADFNIVEIESRLRILVCQWHVESHLIQGLVKHSLTCKVRHPEI